MELPVCAELPVAPANIRQTRHSRAIHRLVPLTLACVTRTLLLVRLALHTSGRDCGLLWSTARCNAHPAGCPARVVPRDPPAPLRQARTAGGSRRICARHAVAAPWEVQAAAAASPLARVSVRLLAARRTLHLVGLALHSRRSRCTPYGTACTSSGTIFTSSGSRCTRALSLSTKDRLECCSTFSFKSFVTNGWHEISDALFRREKTGVARAVTHYSRRSGVPVVGRPDVV